MNTISMRAFPKKLPAYFKYEMHILRSLVLNTKERRQRTPIRMIKIQKDILRVL